MGERGHTAITYAALSIHQAFHASSTLGNETLGDIRTTPDGRHWQFVRADGDIDYGMWLCNPQNIIWYETNIGGAGAIAIASPDEITPALGTWTNAIGNTEGRFVILANPTNEATLHGQGGVVRAHSAVQIKVDRDFTFAGVVDETNVDVLVYEMSLQEVEPCTVTDIGDETYIGCPVVGNCQVLAGVADNEYFWMNIPGRGSIVHALGVAGPAGNITEGDCLRCAGDGKAVPVDYQRDASRIINETFAEAVTGTDATAGLTMAYFLAKWL
jgi:hypothetical protein